MKQTSNSFVNSVKSICSKVPHNKVSRSQAWNPKPFSFKRTNEKQFRKKGSLHLPPKTSSVSKLKSFKKVILMRRQVISLKSLFTDQSLS
jgi:hypothetical protein